MMHREERHGDGWRRMWIALMGVERGRKVHGRACVCWRRERRVAVEGSIWGGVLVPGFRLKNRVQLKTGGGSVFCSCCLTHIIMHYVIQSRYYSADVVGLSLLHADSLPFSDRPAF